jgi:RNA polymerase sigma factor (sigma-70 family)
MADPRVKLLYHFCRLRLPAVALPLVAFEYHLQRAFSMFRDKKARSGETTSWEGYLETIYTPDWFLACSCLERQPQGWQELFAARASRTDCLLVDALRLRAVHLFPRDVERQDEAVAEFWGYLLAGQRDGSPPILARYDGQRPLVPWLIRVFQNKHLSDLRHRPGFQPLPDEDLGDHDLTSVGRDPFTVRTGRDEHERWYDEFRQAAREWLNSLTEQETLILGLRLRYRLSQREVALLLGIHEGNVSRQTARLRDHCLEQIGKRLQDAGWSGEDPSGFVFKEMDGVLLDEPGLTADRLAGLLAGRGKRLPPSHPVAEASS